ncbi:MAG: MBL fold metallo-hydrolase [Lachnospiraceae bacterium]|nr:MBL fold metallo-hydrolase [Lachnospiraceae bacterium]
MKLCSVASGSSGNCIFVGSEHTSLLVDAGISGKRTAAGVEALDRSMQELDGILVTHEHSDHIRGLGVLARKYKLPVYATAGTIEEIRRTNPIGKLPEGVFHEIVPDQVFTLGDIDVYPFRISHDAAEPVGYRFDCGEKHAAVATDMGMYDRYIVDKLRGLDVLLLESNHDERMLEVGRYPYYLKRRIAGNSGHLSNETAGRLLCEILHDGMKEIFLGHLSQENNYEDLAFETVCSEITMGKNPYRAADFHIEVAHRDRISEAVDF